MSRPRATRRPAAGARARRRVARDGLAGRYPDPRGLAGRCQDPRGRAGRCPDPRGRAGHRLAGAALLAALVLTTLAPAARAAPYVVVGCADPGRLGQPGQVVRPTDGWVAEGLVGPGGDTCAHGAAGRGMLAYGSGAFAGFAFAAPPGTTLTGAWTWYAAHLPAGTTGAVSGLVSDAGSDGEWTPVPPAVSWLGGGPLDLGGGWAHTPLSDTNALRFGVRCAPGPCDPADTPRVEVHSIGVAVDDPAAPVIAPLGGSLLAGGVQQGVRRLQIAVSDEGGGIASLSAAVGGRAVDGWTGCASLGALFATAPHYDHRVPCPPSVARAIAVDTTSLPDGPQPVEVRAVDAAGNAQAAGAQVLVDNHPPGPGVVSVTGQARSGERLQATSAGFEGQDPELAFTWQRCRGDVCRSRPAHGNGYVLGPGDVGRRLRVRVVATDHGGSTTAYSGPTDIVSAAASAAPPAAGAGHVPNGRHADAHARVSAWFEDAHGRRSRHVTVRPGTRVRIRGTVADAAGRGIAGAALELTEYVNARAAPLTSVRTRPDGRFTAVARAGPSRTLRLSYRPFSDSRRPRRSPLLRLTVRR